MKHYVYFLSFLIVFLTSCAQRNETISDTLTNKKTNDTLIADNYILTFNESDSFALTDIFGDLNYRIQLTDTIGNWHERAIKIQEYLKTPFGQYFFIKDSTLVLKLSNGEIKSFPLWDNEKEEGFCFEHYFKDIDYYLLHVQWFEGGCKMLVNRKNGYSKYICGLPYISDKKTKILSINSDLEAGYSFNGLELHSITRDSLQTEFRKETNWGPISVKWLTENKFLIKRGHLDFETMERNIDYKQVTIEKKNSR